MLVLGYIKQLVKIDDTMFEASPWIQQWSMERTTALTGTKPASSDPTDAFAARLEEVPKIDGTFRAER